MVSPTFKGSTLEDTFKQNITRTPLWSAKPVQESPELMVDAHLAFLRAGAEIILTSTYVYIKTRSRELLHLNPGVGTNVHERRSSRLDTLPRRVSRSCRSL
jgi:S-methylmethionine-dependent homocysteine/selenocysteine methylase